MKHAHGLRAAAVAATLIAAALSSCRDTGPTVTGTPKIVERVDSAAILASMVRTFEMALTPASVCTGVINADCSVSYAVDPADWQCASSLSGKCRPLAFWTSITGTPTNSNGDMPAPQLMDVTLTFDSTVWAVVVKMHGAVNCSGKLPTLTARNGVDAVVSVDTVELAPASDCGDDDIAGNAVDTIPMDTVTALADTFFFRGAVKKLQITGVNPWQWQLDTLDAFAKLFWSVEFYQLPPGNDCSTGDALLDMTVMRAFLKRLRDSSNWNDPVTLNRRERGGWVYTLASGDMALRTTFTSNDEWCQSQNPLLALPAGARVLAGVHTHPFSPNDTLPLSQCSAPNPPYGQPMAGHPSSEDIDRVRRDSMNVGGYPIKGYVMDKDSIYVIPPGTTWANRLANVIGFPLSDTAASCSRP